MVLYSHRKEVGNHEDPEGASDHLPHEHVADALLLGWKCPGLQSPARVPHRQSGGSPEAVRAERDGPEGALDLQRNHRDARAVIR